MNEWITMSGLLDENFELELEIICSMYDNVKVYNSSLLLESSSSSLSSLSSLSTTSISCILELVLVPRVLSSSSFVEATIQLHIPNTYVHNSDLEINASDDSYSYVPKLVIVRTSGLPYFTGGTLYVDGIYRYHKFTGLGILKEIT